MHGAVVITLHILMNVKTYKNAVAKKCKSCVGEESIKYKADSAELIEVCSRVSCSLHKLRPRKPKEQTEIERMLQEVMK